MKVGVIGGGRVGAACALSLVARVSARELVIVDRGVTETVTSAKGDSSCSI